MSKLPAFKAVEKFLADVVSDSIRTAEDSSSAQKMMEFSNLLPDALALLPVISNIEAEAVSLQPADYADLVATLAIDMAIPAGKVANIVQASLKFIENLILVTLPDVQGIVAAANS